MSSARKNFAVSDGSNPLASVTWKKFQCVTLDDDRFVFDKKGCTDPMQRIGVVSQLFWQCRARENYGKLLKSLCEEEIAKLLPQKRSKKIQKSAHG